MEPQIQYVTTSDGVNIAYYAIGQGPATLFLSMPTSHLEAEWRIDPLRMWFTAEAQRSTFIRMDPRGFGLSDRDPDDFTLDSLVLDIDAVVGRPRRIRVPYFLFSVTCTAPSTTAFVLVRSETEIFSMNGYQFILLKGGD